MYTAKGSLAGLAVFSADQERDGAGRLALMSRPASRRRRRRARPVLPATDRPARPADRQRRGAGPLDAPERGLVTRRVHPARRARPASSSGSRARATEAIRQAGPGSSPGLRVPIAVNLSMRNVHDPQLPRRSRSCSSAGTARRDLLRARDHRDASSPPIRSARCRRMDSLRALGRAHRHRRLRHRLLVARRPQAPAARRDQDRPLLRHRHARRRSERDDRARHRRARTRARLRVVAEGVENAETRQRLTALGCDAIQGFLVSRPMPADQTAEWIGRSSLVATLP